MVVVVVVVVVLVGLALLGALAFFGGSTKPQATLIIRNSATKYACMVHRIRGAREVVNEY